MRPALQRLLARPSSLDLLRYLTEAHTPVHNDPKCFRITSQTCRMYSSCSATALTPTEHDDLVRFVKGTNFENGLTTKKRRHLRSKRRNASPRGKGIAHNGRQTKRKFSPWTSLASEQSTTEPQATIPFGGAHYPGTHRVCSGENDVSFKKLETEPRIKVRRSGARHVSGFHGEWKERTWTHEELEFESDLSNFSSSRPRLLKDPKFREDFNLWAGLLEYRQRVHGLDGVKVFWKAIRREKLQIPVFGSLASNFWKTFLTLGFSDPSILQDIWRYADELLETTGQRWSSLYVTVIEHLLLTGQGQRAQAWHNRLIENHPPGPRSFAEMCRQVCLWNGDMEALKFVYERNNLANAYAKIVPLLCEQQKYKIALKWHFLLVKHKDLPKQMKSVDLLLRHFTTFENETAKAIAESLIEAEVPFSEKLSAKYDEHMILSAEMMNIIHGKTFHVPPKKYNDRLGARWFATTWISLDVAMNGVHALGIQEIGPLSLQAIALRETDPQSVSHRINQLEALGISIGESVYSRAIQHFAKDGQHEFLEGLLQSDYHPDSLEDWRLQEDLLVSYAQANDWSQYRRTLAIRVVASKSRPGEAQNVELRSLICRGDLSATRSAISHMQLNKIPIHSKTMNYLVMKILRTRQRGRRPIALPRQNRDLEMVIEILKDIMRSGIYLSSRHWREIIRRLGMMGRLSELYRLSVFLANWHNPAIHGMDHNAPIHIRPTPRPRISTAVPTSHPLHPLRVLFPTPLQKSIVEWGFIKGLESRPKLSDQNTQYCLIDNEIQTRSSAADITFGIRLLQKLQESGVHVDARAVRSAVFERLVQYYGHGYSQRLRNRAAKANNPLSLDEMAGQINSAMGGHAFPRIADLKAAVEAKSLFKLRRRRFRAERLTTRGTSATTYLPLLK